MHAMSSALDTMDPAPSIRSYPPGGNHRGICLPLSPENACAILQFEISESKWEE